jgi:hypothetical protein
MFWNRRLNKRITVDEEFDADDPMARAMRSLVPPDAPMDPQSRDYMMGHLFSIQRRLSRQRDRHPEPQRLRPALVPAIAILVVLAVMAAVMLPVFLGGRGGAPVQQAQVARFGSIAGKVLVLAPGGKWRAASARDRIGQGWRVRTASGGKASVDFGDQSIMRVTESSEARIARLGSREISVEHVSGGTYHRVHKGTRYTVFNSDVASHALGTAFNIENRVPGHLEILTVESAVEVAIGSHGPIKVAQGEVMTVSLSEDKKADKQPVSRERLQDERLMASVKQDEQAGFSTGIYEEVDVTGTQPPASPGTEPVQPATVQLQGDVSDTGVTLTWGVSGDTTYQDLVLLRSEGAEPVYPDNEIARYTDTSITSASDNSIQKGHTYQYRLAATRESGEVVYSNTIVVDVPARNRQPEAVTVSLSASPVANGVTVEWSVSGASRFSGFVLERVVSKAPDNSQTPQGSSISKVIDSGDVFYSYLDDTVVAGHTYSYRVGLVVDGAVMLYSDWRQAAK